LWNPRLREAATTLSARRGDSAMGEIYDKTRKRQEEMDLKNIL